MADQGTVPASNFTAAPTLPVEDDVLRQTEHRAVSQAAPTDIPEVSYEAEDYQPAPVGPNIEAYQPPAGEPVQPPAAEQFTPTQPITPTPPVPQATQTTPQNRFPGVDKPIPEEIVVEWQSLSRPFKKRSRQFYSTGLIIVILVSLILFFAQQFLPIAVVIAVAFLAYVLSVVPPGMVRHSLTTYGVRIEDQLYFWEELGRFWFTDKYSQRILHIEVGRFPWRLTILLGDISEADMTEILSEVLVKQKPVPTTMEKASDWLQAKIPLDSD